MPEPSKQMVMKQCNHLWEGQQLGSVERESPIISSTAYKCDSPCPHSSSHCGAAPLTVLLKAFVERRGLLALPLNRLLLASSFQETALTFYQQVVLSSLPMASFDFTWTLLQVLKQLLKHRQQSWCYFLFLCTGRHSLSSQAPGF